MIKEKLEKREVRTAYSRLQEDVNRQKITWSLCWEQAFVGVDKVGTGSRHKGEFKKWTAGSSQEKAEKDQNHKKV